MDATLPMWELAGVVLVNGLAVAIMYGRLTERVANLKERMESNQQAMIDVAVKVSTLDTNSQKLSVALWGYDGNNGLRGNLKEVSNKMEHLQRESEATRTELANFHNRFDRLDETLGMLKDHIEKQ